MNYNRRWKPLTTPPRYVWVTLVRDRSVTSETASVCLWNRTCRTWWQTHVTRKSWSACGKGGVTWRGGRRGSATSALCSSTTKALVKMVNRTVTANSTRHWQQTAPDTDSKQHQTLTANSTRHWQQTTPDINSKQHQTLTANNTRH